MKYRYFIFLLLLSMVFGAGMALADLPGEETFEERIPISEPEVEPLAQEISCGWGTRVSAGVPVWFFDDEDTEAGAGAYLDVFHCEVPVNLRIGVEGRHMDIEQPGASDYAEWFDKSTQISYFRIPIAAEYIVPVAEATNLYLGGGPDLVRTANDLSDFVVGLHLGGRLAYEFENNISLAVEGGYMWAEVDDNASDIKLDGAFVIPTIGYKF